MDSDVYYVKIPDTSHGLHLVATFFFQELFPLPHKKNTVPVAVNLVFIYCYCIAQQSSLVVPSSKAAAPLLSKVPSGLYLPIASKLYNAMPPLSVTYCVVPCR